MFAALERTGWPEILVDQPADQKSPGQSSTVRNPRQPNRKVKPAEVDELAARYEAGETLRALAARFGVHARTVHRHLVASGATIRPLRGLNGQEAVRAVELYREGISQTEIAGQLGVTITPVRTALRRGGDR